MKLKHLFEYNLKTQDFPNTKQYEYVETENYIFLKLNDFPTYALCDDNKLLSSEENNYYLSNMKIPSKINKETLIDFFDDYQEYFNKIILWHEYKYDFNNLKTIFSKNYMGYSDWDICNADLNLSYELKNILFNNVSEKNIRIHQISDLKIISGGRFELKSINYSYPINTHQRVMTFQDSYLKIPFIVRRK